MIRNFICILNDDLGYGDLSCYGSRKISTPNIDRMASEGTRFTTFYAASAVCSPSRVSYFTGRYPIRFNVTSAFNPFKRKDASLPVVGNLANLLKAGGRATAHVGKWHMAGMCRDNLNQRPEVAGPREHGFDHYLADLEENYKQELDREGTAYSKGGAFLVEDDVPTTRKGHMTDIEGADALSRIDRFHAANQPFFLNLWFHAPHTPIEASPELYRRPYLGRARGKDLAYRSMVTHMDDVVGRVFAKLRALGLDRDTLVFFGSDHGPAHRGDGLRHGPGSAGNLSYGKHDIHEGGIRVPAIFWAPGVVAAGKTVSFPCHSNDLLPTALSMLEEGGRIPDEADGIDLSPWLDGGEPPVSERALCFQKNRANVKYFLFRDDQPPPTEAIRKGPYKLLCDEGRPTELYNLEEDPWERWNLLEDYPEVAEALSGELRSWLAEPRHCAYPAGTFFHDRIPGRGGNE